MRGETPEREARHMNVHLKYRGEIFGNLYCTRCVGLTLANFSSGIFRFSLFPLVSVSISLLLYASVPLLVLHAEV